MPIVNLPQAALGRDIAAYAADPEDIDPFFSLASGPRAAAEAIVAALAHEPNTLWWAIDRGTSLRAFLHRTVTPPAIAAAVESECLKDERVADATVTASVLGNEVRLQIELQLKTTETVQFTLNVDDASSALALSGV